MPRRLDILPDKGFDSGVVGGGVRDVLDRGAFLEAAEAVAVVHGPVRQSGGAIFRELRVPDGEFPFVGVGAAVDLALLLVGPHEDLHVGGVAEEAGCEIRGVGHGGRGNVD